MGARFLIEVPHDVTRPACAHAIEVFLKTGSHFLTHADWGCKDGVHKAWIVVDVDTREQAMGIVPAAFRSSAVIVRLNAFTAEDVELLRQDAGH